MDVFNPKKIRQIQLKFKQNFPPYKYLSPYLLMAELSKLVKERYDIEFVHIKYIQTKNSQQKYLDSHMPTQETLQVDFQYNNVFSDQFQPHATEFLKNVLFDKAEKLIPPTGYNPEEFQKNTQFQIRQEEMKKLNNLNEKIKILMKVYNDKAKQDDLQEITSIDSFRTLSHKETFENSEFEIYSKAIMNQAVYDKIKTDSKQKTSGVEIKYKGVSIWVYLNPTTEEQSIERIHPEYFVNNWSLNVLHDSIFCNYFGTNELEEKVKKINSSIQTTSSISFNYINENVESIGIMTYFWSETVMKTVIKMSQIKKIEKAVVGKTHHYYFHLVYPPKYYLNEMKKDEANIPKYMKFFDRVINFIFLRNTSIEENYFLRYFLFNNSIVKISIDLEDNKRLREGYEPVEETYQKLEHLCRTFEGTIQYFDRGNSQYEGKYSLKFLSKLMDYKSFIQNKKNHLPKQIQDKFWIIKYLILVMVRFNYINPTDKEISSIMGCIEEDKNIQYLDCYLYVLWRTATNMWGYDDKKRKFSQFFNEECQDVKKMDVKNLMKRMLEESDSIVYIFRVSLTPSGYLFNPPTPEMKGRLLKQYAKHSQFFMRVSLAEESQIELKNQKFITKVFFRKYMNQIIILDRSYIPLGWSPSQLRSFSLWYVHQISGRPKIADNEVLPQLRRWRILQFLGDFQNISNHAKKAARIGQSFSSSWTYNGSDIKSQIIDDVFSSTSMCFTDGIGRISEDLLEKISNKLNIRDLSVIQIRYKGAKGVLVLDPELGKNEIKLRPSMIKFECHDKRTDLYLDILDWNKYKAGFLNRQVIILLRTLEIQDDVFTRLQQQHITNISKMTFKDCSIFKHMSQDLNNDINNLEPANKTILNLLNAGFELEREPFFRGVLETLKRNGYYQLKMKSNICVQKSARLIGIIDQDGILQEDEVYCSIYDHFAEIENKNDQSNKKKDKLVREIVNSNAIITRNPCLDPADIRIVRCVGEIQVQERFQKLGKQNNKFSQLQNVVVMPMKGKYPLTSQISGSDLDGDNFFICWDDRLIPKTAHEANLIDEPLTNKKDQKPTETLNQSQNYQKMLDFFIDYTNYEKLGQIDNSHLVHADKDSINFANNQKCRKLAKIHGKAVDFPKTGYCPPIDPSLFCSEYPDFMQKENGKTYVSNSILGKLYQDIKQQIQSLLEDKVYVGVSQIDKSLIHSYKFDQTREQVLNCLKDQRQYEREMTNLITLIGVDTQYEVYSGNFSTVKDKVKSFGKNRLIATILSIRDRFFELFFKDLESDEEKYKETGYDEKHMKKPEYFSYEARRKSQLYYLISYIRKFPDIRQDKLEGFNQLKENILECLEELKIMNKESKYCGFVWFIIPKIILNLKITFNASLLEKPQEQLSGEEYNSGPEEDDEFI